MNTGITAPPTLSRLQKLGYILLAAVPVLALVDLFPVFHLSSLNIRPTDLLFVALWIVCGLDMLFTMHAPRGVVPYLACIVAYEASFVVGALFLNNAIDWPSHVRFLETMLWGVLALAFIRREAQFHRYADMVLLCALAISGSSIYLFIKNPEFQRLAGYMALDSEGMGILNEWGSFYVVGFTIVLWRIYRYGWSLRRLAVLSIISMGLLLVQSRSAFLSVAVTTLIFMRLWIRKMNREGIDWRTLAAAGCLAMLVAGMVVGSAYLPTNRIKESFAADSYEASSTRDRYIGWERGGQMISDANAGQLLVGYGNERFFQITQTTTSESFYIDHGVSEGFLGLGIILVLLLAPVCKLYRKGIFDDYFVLAMLITVNALVVSITGNVLVSSIFGGSTFCILYASVSVNRPAGALRR